MDERKVTQAYQQTWYAKFHQKSTEHTTEYYTQQIQTTIMYVGMWIKL